MSKKNILITWENGYIFEDNCYDILKELFNNYNIYIVLVDMNFSQNQIELLKNDNNINYINIVPFGFLDQQKIEIIKNTIDDFRDIKIDYFISDSFSKIIDYILIQNNSYIQKSQKILFHPNVANLYIDTKNILKYNDNILEYKNDLIYNVKKDAFFYRLSKYIKYKFFTKNIDKINQIYERYLYKKNFDFDISIINQLFRISVDFDIDKMVFLDMFEANSFGQVFQNSKVYFTKLDVEKIKCDKTSKKLLIFESGFEMFSVIPNEVLDVYINDINNIVKAYDIQQIDLKPHPRNRELSYILKDRLIQKKINTNILENCKIKDIIKNYSVCTSVVSGALRTVKQIADIDVICLEKSSKYFYYNPFLIMGDGNGIMWLLEDGSIVDKNPYIKDINIQNNSFIDILEDK